MININGLKRNAKNIVKKYSDPQIKVREATSNDPWGPSSTIMAEIADLTYNVVAFSEIMQMIWKRLNDHGHNWRHVYKALVLLEYLIKTGSDKVAQQCIENIFAIQTLKDFQFMEENKDHGMNIREKSKKLVALLKDSEKLHSERERAMKAKSRLTESMSSTGKSSLGSITSSHGDTSNNSGGSFGYMSENNNNNNGPSQSDAPAILKSDRLDSARPQSLTEEENQLKLALALSKEEAEKQEKTRKNDELRLKLALDFSKKATGPGASLLDELAPPGTPTVQSTAIAGTSAQTLPAAGPSKTTIDDLLGLTIPAPEVQPTPTTTVTATPATSHIDPWGVDPWQPVASASTSNFDTLTTQAAAFAPIAAKSTAPHPDLALLVAGSTTSTNDILKSRPVSKNPFED